MKSETYNSSVPKKQILFLFPLMYRPQKENIAKNFNIISRWYDGHIFALSGGKQRNVPVADFLFHAEIYGSGSTARFFRGLWIQIVVPVQMLLGKSRVSVVIAYDPYRSGLAALALRYVLRCKMIVEINGDYHISEPDNNFIRKSIMRVIFNLVLRGADAIKVLNIDQEKFCRQFSPKKAVYRFPPFVATEYFESLESYQGDYLLSVGHPFDLKGMDVLIEAFQRIALKHPDVKLKIMGYCSTAERERYRTISRGHPRIGFIEPGWVEEVGEQMRGCYALVNAARSEALGRVHVEAMACGKPIIATRTNGALECIEDGQTGLLCKINDIEDLAEKLDELLSNPNRAVSMGQAGKKRMHELFSEKAYAEAFHNMLDMVAEGSVVV